MHMIYVLFSAGKNDFAAESMCKPGFVINPSSGTVFTLRKVCHKKTRPSNLADDPVIYLVSELMFIYPYWLIASPLNGPPDTIDVCGLKFIIKPHCHEGLIRIWVRFSQFFHTFKSRHFKSVVIFVKTKTHRVYQSILCEMIKKDLQVAFPCDAFE